MKERKYLITGGSGFIGSHFHNYIPKEDIVNFDINNPPKGTESDFWKGDIRNIEDLRAVFSAYKFETVISLAAKHHDFGIGHDEYFDTNEDGTRALCQAASERGVKEIIFYSSVAVYGLGYEITDETTLPSPDGPYGASKLAGEKVLIEWAEQDPERKVLILRPTIVFGSNNRANMYNLIRQVDSGFYFHLGGTKTIKSIAYVENLVQATLFLKDRLKSGMSIYNYADEPQMTTREIANTIAGRLNKKIRLTVPLGFAIFLGLPFDLAIKLTGKNLPISTARIRKLATQTQHSAGKLFSEGFSPTFSSVEGLIKMVDWYKTLKRS